MIIWYDDAFEKSVTVITVLAIVTQSLIIYALSKVQHIYVVWTSETSLIFTCLTSRAIIVF